MNKGIIIVLAFFLLFQSGLSAQEHQSGQIIIKLFEQGEVPGDGYSKNDTNISYTATHGANGIEVNSFVYHSGKEEKVLTDGTYVLGSYGKIEESIKIDLGVYDAKAWVDNHQSLVNLNQISETREEGGISRSTNASSGNWQTIDVSAYLQGCKTGDFSSMIEGNSVVFRSPDGKFVGGETQSGGWINSHGLPYNYRNEGQVAITNQAKIDLGNYGKINASAGYVSKTPGITYGARTESYLDLYQGKNFRGASATVKTSSGPKAGN